MKFPIGFSTNDSEQHEQSQQKKVQSKTEDKAGPQPSMVLVRFPSRNISLSYYNDQFNLTPGDIVFVDGKYEGTVGIVEKVSTNFNVNLEHYKKVLGLADTDVRGTFYQAGSSHLITFDPSTLPYRQGLSWYKPLPVENSFISYEEDGFPLCEIGKWPFSHSILDRGLEYYNEDKVVYLSLENGQVNAIVTGSHPYEVSFTYSDGQVSDLRCDCPCGFGCKHEVAAMFQLQEILNDIADRYPDQMGAGPNFAAVFKGSFFSFALRNRDITLTLS